MSNVYQGAMFTLVTKHVISQQSFLFSLSDWVFPGLTKPETYD